MPIVNVHLGAQAEAIAKRSNYNLCLARKVDADGKEEDGNVVFSSVLSRNLGPQVQFQWEDQYRVFETRTFQAGLQVVVSTDVNDIVGGQTTTFNIQGRGLNSGDPLPDAPFNVVNDWVSGARVGVKHFDVITGIPVPIFISGPLLRGSASKLLPIQKFTIFWSGILKTNTMYDTASTPAFEFNMTGYNAIDLEYTVVANWVINSES